VDEQIKEMVRTALALLEQGERERVWHVVQPLVEASARQALAAEALAYLVQQGAFGRERALALAARLLDHHANVAGVVVGLGLASEQLVDVGYLNDAPSDAPVLLRLAGSLRTLSRTATDPEQLQMLVHALARTARLLGRAWDDVAEAAFLRCIELSPGNWECQYDLGLFYKTRGRFREGQAANQRAFDGGGGEDESVRWNLGICATGAGDAETALRVWKLLGQTIQLGRFGLPEGSYDLVKVRLAQRPLAERSADEDDPGAEETIWIERLSPCHGVVRSALHDDDIGIDFGDVVLFDGAAFTRHEVNGKQVPVFPHLATLVRSRYRIYPFVGTQQQQHQLSKLSTQLPEDTVIYSHSEQMASDQHAFISGKLCAPPSLSAPELLAAVDRVLASAPGVRLFAPELCVAAGQLERAQVERRRTAMLASDRPSI
jgi:hypothetical protein